MNRDIPRYSHCKSAVLCTHSQFSYYTIEAIVDEGIIPKRLIVPGVAIKHDSDREITNIISKSNDKVPDHSLQVLADRHNIELCYDQLLDPKAFVDGLNALGINLLLIACFPYKIPDLVYDAVCTLNIHPSLLPAFKGPSPLFWQLFFNEKNLGVSLHYLSQDWDSGDIVSQSSTPRTLGSDESSLNRQLASLAGQLLHETLNRTWHSTMIELEESYFGKPQADDFRLNHHWKTQHAYDFMLGTLSWGLSYHYTSENGIHLSLSRPIAANINKSMAQEILVNGNRADIKFSDGVLVAELEPS